MNNNKLMKRPALVAAVGVSCLFFLACFIIYGGSWSTIQSPLCTAVVRTRVNPPNEFIGASAGITIYKPRVQNGQSSSARIKLVNGAHTIEAGWMVNPDVFGDDNPHLYTRFTAKGKSCINTQCEGFVQVPNKYGGLGLSSRYSVAGGTPLHLWDISIQKREDNNWWLFLTTKKVAIGYWPGKLVAELAESASMVEWGGEVSNPSLIYPPPEMGNGNKARYDTSYSASFIQLSTVDKNGRQINPNATEKATTCVGPYRVLDAGYQGHDLGRIIFYG